MPALEMGCPNHADVDEGLVRCVRCLEAYCPDCVVALGGDPYCGACKDEQVRNVLSGTTAGFELAGMGRRFTAFILDGFIKVLIVYAILIPIVTLGVFGVIGASAASGGGQPSQEWAGALGVFLMFAWFAASIAVPMGVDLLYEALMLRRWGQTLGKMALGLKVVTPDGNDLTAGQVWGRSALKAALGTMCVLVDDASALFTQERTAVHDLVVKSRVARLQG
jgi:uncharacterized RDD family membrane protein YckC